MIHNNKKGFSLLEIMCVLVIMGVVFAFALPRMVNISGAADEKVLGHAIANLTATEKLTWTNLRLGGLYVDDADLLDTITYVVEDCRWIIGPTATGGNLKCGKAEADLTRIISDNTKPAEWRK